MIDRRRTNSAAAELLVDVTAASTLQAGAPVVIGVPFPPGALPDALQVAAKGPDGEFCPAAGRALSRWPDGSVRWCLLSLLAARKGVHQITARSAAPASPRKISPVQVHQEGDRWVLDNGLVQLVLSASGAGPIEHLSYAGRTVLSSATSLRLCVDDADTTRERRRLIHVIEQNSLRVRMRVEGSHQDAAGSLRLAYRLGVELWANWPCVRLDYQFLNLHAGIEELILRRIAMELRLAIQGNSRRIFQQKHHGVFYRPRMVENPDRVCIVADDTRGSAHVQDAAMLLDREQYPSQLHPPLVDTAPWIAVKDEQLAVLLGVEDFEEMRPKELWSDGSMLGLAVWPEAAGKLMLPQGRSRRVSATLAFADSDKVTPALAAELLQAPRAEGRACISTAWMAYTGEFEQDRILPFAQHARFEQFFRRLVNLEMPQGMFDLGDTPDASYQQVYIPLGLQAVGRRANAPEFPRVFLAGEQHRTPAWGLPQLYEQIWTNNEYDVIHALATELLRTGRAGLFPALRRAVRHNIEVDFVHYSDYRWCHRATPAHCSRHTNNGAYPSHFWTQGLLEYYCLTGDEDVLEVARALGEKILEVFEDAEHREVLWGFNRELGWPMITLSCLADLTGDERCLAMLDRIVDFLVGFDRENLTGQVKLSGVDPRQSFVRQMFDSFFGFASMIEGVDRYLRLRKRAEVEQWLVNLLRELRTITWQAQREGQSLHPRSMLPLALAIGYERTGEDEFLAAGMACLEHLIESPAWLNPAPETKAVAMLHRGLVRFLGHAQRNGRLDSLEYASRRALE